MAVAAVDFSLLLECSLCQKSFREPRMLSCGHTFCKECLQKQLDLSLPLNNNQIICAFCKQITSLLDQSVTSLPVNFFVKMAVAASSAVEERHSDIIHNLTCTFHANKEVCLYCVQCNEFICYMRIT
jgi:tripartite motif-containing protein 2/3